MNAPASVTVTTVRVAELLRGRGMPLDAACSGDVAVWFDELDEPHSEGQPGARARAVATEHGVVRVAVL
jgi:hypothetical protein